MVLPFMKDFFFFLETISYVCNETCQVSLECKNVVQSIIHLQCLFFFVRFFSFMKIDSLCNEL